MSCAGCCRVVLAIILICLNLVAVVLGLFIMIACGIFLSKMIEADIFTTELQAPLILGILMGFVLLIIATCAILGAVFAICGSLKIFRILATIVLIGYIIIVILYILLELALSVVLFVKSNELRDSAYLWYNKSVVDNIRSDNLEYLEHIDKLQTAFQCCGLSGPRDFLNTTLTNGSGYLPQSCCKVNDTMLLTATYNTTCLYNSTNLIMTGCYSKIEGLINDNIIPIAVVGVIVGLGEIACVIIPILLIIIMFAFSRKDGYEKA